MSIRLSAGAARTAAVAVLALVLAATPIFAQDVASPSARQRADTRAAAPGPIPGRTETPMEAYGKLNRSSAGYLTRDDVRQLAGFETAFQQADQNHDGRLTPAEFNSAWAMYTGANP
jgi:hypothetical protein